MNYDLSGLDSMGYYFSYLLYLTVPFFYSMLYIFAMPSQRFFLPLHTRRNTGRCLLHDKAVQRQYFGCYKRNSHLIFLAIDLVINVIQE